MFSVDVCSIRVSLDGLTEDNIILFMIQFMFVFTIFHVNSHTHRHKWCHAN